MKDCECIKSLNGDLVVICDKTGNTLESVVINSSDGISYWLIAVVLLAITCLLLLVAIIVKDCMKSGLTIPCLLSY